MATSYQGNYPSPLEREVMGHEGRIRSLEVTQAQLTERNINLVNEMRSLKDELRAVKRSLNMFTAAVAVAAVTFAFTVFAGLH